MSRLIAVLLAALSLRGVARADDWPQWRGPARDGISKETGLLQDWPAEGPALRWKATGIGTGYSSPSIARGRVYLQATRDAAEFALALDEKTGAKIWEVPIGKVGKNRGPQYPGTRSTPTFDGDRLYCLASDGELVCLEAAGGAMVWKKHLRNDFGGADGNWAYSESVLIDGHALICTPGGQSAALAALDKNTGEVLWKAAVPDGGTAEYASIMAVDHGAVKEKEYVTFLRKGLVGVEAKSGKFLWIYNKTIDPGANILTPIVAGDRVFSAGSRTGGGLVQIRTEGEGATATQIYFAKAVAPSIGGAVLLDGKLYGTSAQAMFCADFGTGEVKWTDRALGPASLCSADRRLYVRSHTSGDVALVAPSSEGYREQGRFSPVDRSKARAWPHPVVANGGLYLRDQEVLLCYDVSAR
jgi:outer membrane protein assembly factor BamB